MRIGCMMVLCAVLGGGLAACSSVGMGEAPRTFSLPPTETALERGLVEAGKALKWVGMVEASPVRQAHLLAPADWIVCAQSSARDLSPPYAMFFQGDKMVHYRIAVQVDECRYVPYAPAVSLGHQASEPLALRP
jgi:hypothetical protein